MPESFDKNGGNFELSVSPVDRNGDLITTGLETRSFDFVDVVITPLNSPGVVVTTGQVTSNNLSVIEPQDPDEPARGVTVTICLDETGSMLSNDPRRLRVEAAQTLVRRLDEGDSAAVLAFALNGRPFSPGMLGSRLLQDFTHDHGLLNRAIESIDAFGSTPLFDAIFDAVSLLDRSHRHNPAAVVLTDGLENASTFATFDSVIELAVRTEIPIFPIGLGTNINFNQLQELARLTGGTFASALNPEALNALFHALGTAVTAGRAIVSARVSFAQPITTPGIYTVSGNLEITIEEQTRTSPFSFQVTIGNPPIARVQRPETELGAPIAIP